MAFDRLLNLHFFVMPMQDHRIKCSHGGTSGKLISFFARIFFIGEDGKIFTEKIDVTRKLHDAETERKA
jgi:Sec7-like guanine-nucleotide exchange factor